MAPAQKSLQSESKADKPKGRIQEKSPTGKTGGISELATLKSKSNSQKQAPADRR